MGLIVYVHSISKDPLWSCRAWKLCPKSCLPKIVKYRTLILNHSCRMSDHVFRREHNIIMITADYVNGRVLDLYQITLSVFRRELKSIARLFMMPCQFKILFVSFAKVFSSFFWELLLKRVLYPLNYWKPVTFANWHLWPAFDISGGFAISPFRIALQLASQQELDDFWPIL